MPAPLTAKQEAILTFIEDSFLDDSRVSVREIAHRFEIVVNAVQGHLDALEKKGMIARDPGARGLRSLRLPSTREMYAAWKREQ